VVNNRLPLLSLTAAGPRRQFLGRGRLTLTAAESKRLADPLVAVPITLNPSISGGKRKTTQTIGVDVYGYFAAIVSDAAKGSGLLSHKFAPSIIRSLNL